MVAERRSQQGTGAGACGTARRSDPIRLPARGLRFNIAGITSAFAGTEFPPLAANNACCANDLAPFGSRWNRASPGGHVGRPERDFH
ncbi:MAG TPA: hypothetical protein VK281_02495, partial [Xanthobacteraceae bacterium]|nr:hypothetical protein [Xanthobacteraceae bacterium]